MYNLKTCNIQNKHTRWLQLGQVGERAELGHVRPALIRLRTGQRRPERHVVKGEQEDISFYKKQAKEDG